MHMRLEKLSLRNFDSPLLEAGSVRQRFVPPSLLPEAQEAAEASAPPPPPAFSEADLKAAEQEGYRRGFLEGTKEGHLQAQSEQAEVDRQLGEAMREAVLQIQHLFDAYNRFAAEQASETPRLALSIARKVAGQALDINPMPLVESTALACLERLVGEPHIVVTVNDRLAAALESRLSKYFKNNTDPGEISIEGDAALPPSDIRLDWAFGKAQRNQADLWQQVEALVGDMVILSGQRESVSPRALSAEDLLPPAEDTGNTPPADPSIDTKPITDLPST